MLTGRRFGDSEVTSWPCSRIRPSSGTSKPAIIRRVVVLPQPLGPSSEKNSPSRIDERHVANGGRLAEVLAHALQFDCDASLRHAR